LVEEVTMPPHKIVPFAPEHLPAAAALLAERQRAQRRAEPALAARFEDPAATLSEIETLLSGDGASGVVALDGSEPIGFLLGTRRDPSWGPNAWVEAAGQAVREPELARDLYAAAASRWVEEGLTSHYVIVPATDRALVDAWFRVGFGHQHVHALREVATVDECGTPEEVTVRRPARADIPALARIEIALPAHQALSPVFSSKAPPTLEESRAEWESDFDEYEHLTFVAMREGLVVGSAIGCPLEVSSMHRGLAHVDHAAFLGFAAVEPAARGRGVGGALLDAVHGWARESGYPTIVTDWRMTNLLSSRMWGNRGFRPTFFRLFRSVV
jgi:ribosomal protein S18 acetylase RimI-like enzyme